MNRRPPRGHAAQWGCEPLLDAIAQALVATGASPATPDELGRLQREGLLDLAEQEEISAAELADTITTWRRGSTSASGESDLRPHIEVDEQDEVDKETTPASATGSAPPLMIPTGGPLPDEPTLARQSAVSRILAASLDEDEAIWRRITRFRREHLGGNLLAWDAVDGWVADHRPGASFQPRTYWLADIPVSVEQIERGRATAPVGYTTLPLMITVPLPLPDRPDDERNSGVGRLEPKHLVYLVPRHERPRWAFVEADGVLDTLRWLAEDLAPAHRHDPQADRTRRPWWTRAQASVFVLTGLAPFVAVLKPLQLALDPTAPLEQIVAQVTQARLRLVGARARELSRKHLYLAVFSAERSDQPWQARQEAWNGMYPEWEYPEKQKSNFIRDSLAAKRRLLLQERE